MRGLSANKVTANVVADRNVVLSFEFVVGVGFASETANLTVESIEGRRTTESAAVGKERYGESSRLEGSNHIVEDLGVISCLDVGFKRDERAVGLGSDVDGGVDVTKQTVHRVATGVEHVLVSDLTGDQIRDASRASDFFGRNIFGRFVELFHDGAVKVSHHNLQSHVVCDLGLVAVVDEVQVPLVRVVGAKDVGLTISTKGLVQVAHFVFEARVREDLSIGEEKIASREEAELDRGLGNVLLHKFDESVKAAEGNSSAASLEHDFVGIDKQAGFGQDVSIEVSVLRHVEDFAFNNIENFFPASARDNAQAKLVVFNLLEVDFEFLFDTFKTKALLCWRKVNTCIKEEILDSRHSRS
jgi:hypothetical protein